MTTRHLMLVPSLACPAECSYCFGPRDGGPSMSPQTLEAAVTWARDRSNGDGPDRLEVVFHGGEPLVAGEDFYAATLPLLSEALDDHDHHVGMQSNLWLLTDGLCELFVEHGVALGTSLDGPEEITDAQRGKGYFRRTMSGIERARRHGFDVGCICTFTQESASRAEEILDFFVREGLDFTVHASVLPLGGGLDESPSLSPGEYGDLLVGLLGSYTQNLDKLKIGTLDSLCRSVSAEDGGICTFRDCLGDYLAVSPGGGIYPCQRFVGHEAFCLGYVRENPDAEQIEATSAWQTLRERETDIEQVCGDCVHLPYCRGGCPYNAFAGRDGTLDDMRDPYCPSYKRIFSEIIDSALEEVFSEENLDEIVSLPGEGTLLRKGPLSGLMRGRPHPKDVSQRAKQILVAAALGGDRPTNETARRLVEMGVARSEERMSAALSALSTRVTTPGRLNNLYLHVTYGCNLSCSHCYAEAGPERIDEEVLSVGRIASLCAEAAGLGFRQVVVTGGEPLVHPNRDGLLDRLAPLRAEVKPLLLVLRTNLSVLPEGDLLARVGLSVDQICVSVDGDRDYHDSRRGAGSYDRTVANLRAVVDMGCDADLSLTTILSVSEVAGPRGEAVRSLGRDLGVRVRFRPVLPIGRAVHMELEPVREAHWAYLGMKDGVAYGFSPSATCGIGQNLYVEPDGTSLPCYARTASPWVLGNVLQEGFGGVLGSPEFRSLSKHTVDTNRQCRSCALRYLCGGACRAWSGPLEEDLDTPPVGCSPLHARARSLLVGVLEHLDIPTETWVRAGFPLPDAPPRVGSRC